MVIYDIYKNLGVLVMKTFVEYNVLHLNTVQMLLYLCVDYCVCFVYSLGIKFSRVNELIFLLC